MACLSSDVTSWDAASKEGSGGEKKKCEGEVKTETVEPQVHNRHVGGKKRVHSEAKAHKVALE